ncbi:MAG: Gfo/Idh/MocA family protein [Candidatus Ratteibacteria bacterium]
MSKKVKIGIIGVGQIGKKHIERYKTIQDVEIVAVCDINEEEAKKVCEIYNIPKFYNDFRELLRKEDIEAVDVCLHNNLHMPVTVEALNCGKHVYCEKPMAGSYIDALTMYETAKRNKKHLSIQLSTLFSKDTKGAKILIEKGYLGKIYYARSTGYRRLGRPFVDGYGSKFFVQKEISAGGALYDMGVYHIANLLYLMDNPEVLRISGKTYSELEINEERREISGYNVEELGIGFVRFKNNITMEVVEAWAIHLDQFESSYIVGSEGGVRLNPLRYFTNISDLPMDATFNLDIADYRWHNVYEIGDAYDSPQHHWIAVLQGRVELLPTAEIALNTMLISEGIYLSDKLGREVTSDEVKQNSKSTALKI